MFKIQGHKKIKPLEGSKSMSYCLITNPIETGRSVWISYSKVNEKVECQSSGQSIAIGRQCLWNGR